MSHFSLVDQIDNIKGKLTDKEYMDLMNTIAEAKKESEKVAQTEEDRKTAILTGPSNPQRIVSPQDNGWEQFFRHYPNLSSSQNTWIPTNSYTERGANVIINTNSYTTTYNTIGSLQLDNPNGNLDIGISIYYFSEKDILDNSRIIVPAGIHTAYLPKSIDLRFYYISKLPLPRPLQKTFYSATGFFLSTIGDDETIINGDKYIPPNKNIKFMLEVKQNSCTFMRMITN